MRETWYVLDDGTCADPSECAPDDSGVLRHKGGAKVAMRSAGVPFSRGVDADEARKAPEARDAKAGRTKVRYSTRDLKAD